MNKMVPHLDMMLQTGLYGYFWAKRFVVNYTCFFLPFFLFNYSTVEYWHEQACVYGELVGMEVERIPNWKHPGHRRSPFASKAWIWGIWLF